MRISEIIILILAIINIIAFASAIWVSYDEWKKHKTLNWIYPLEGLFFIPLCILIAIGWPWAKYKDYRKKIKKRKEYEESKKYNFQRFAFRVKELPFKPSSDEVVYVESEYNERINQLITRNYEYIKECFEKADYYKSRFIYFPYLIENLLHEEEVIDYLIPYKNSKSFTSINLGQFNLLDYLLVPENRSKISPCFARYRGDEEGYHIFDCVGFAPEEGIDELSFFKALCSTFDIFPRPTGVAYQTKKVSENDNCGADDKFDKESKRLIKEVEERIFMLRRMGISQWALEQLVKPELILSKLVIKKDYRILLPDYNNMEIKMEPLAKAVYLLFLKHPEGIMFKCLPDYRKELAEIYNRLRPLGLTDKAIRSIEDVTNPLLNSINEKCARIRGAFVGQFDDHMARHYYIDGRRGEAKKISLPRDLVIWEE